MLTTQNEVQTALSPHPTHEHLPTGLVLDEGLSFTQWSAIGGALGTMERGLPWWIGDWVNYGERTYGEKYAQAIQETGREPQTLMNYAWVASRFEISRRRENLSWSHHEAVAGIEDVAERERLLDEAERHQWSRMALREAVSGRKKAIPAPKPDNLPPAGGSDTDAEAGSEQADAFDSIAVLEQAQSRILQKEAEIESLRKNDKDAEISRLHEVVARLEGLRTADQNRAIQQEKIITGQRRVLDSLKNLLKVDSFGDILPAVQDMLR